MLDSLKRGEDDSLTSYLQRDDPGGDRTANRLPAPDGPSRVVLRPYLPQAEALDDSWKRPPIRRAE